MSELLGKLVLKATALIRDGGLVFLLLLVGGVAALAVYNIPTFVNPLHVVEIVLIVVSVIGGALLGLSIHYRFKHARVQKRDLRRDLGTQIVELQRRLDSPPVKLVNRADYREIIHEWAASGPGEILLFNVELQSFEDQKTIENTWGDIARLENVKHVVLLLPPQKVHRWENIVLANESGFFRDPVVREKFLAVMVQCDAQTYGRSGADTQRTEFPSTLAFASYAIGSRSGDRWHAKMAVFILSSPFADQKPSRFRDDPPWWDYDRIFKFDSTFEANVQSRLTGIWSRYYRDDTARDVDRVLQDIRPLDKVEPTLLLPGLGMPADDVTELMRYLDDRRKGSVTPQVIAHQTPRGSFEIKFSNGDVIDGRFRGVDTAGRHTRTALVVVGGFTEPLGGSLVRQLKQALRDDEVIQFSYDASTPPQFTTVTRYAEDMSAVLRYVKEQTAVVDRSKIVLVARSINAFVAIRVAAEMQDELQLAGVVLVAPVFDVVAMLDNYIKERLKSLGSSDLVRVENCWRRSPGYSASRWENHANGWLNFFGQPLRLTLLADIIRRAPEKHRLEEFIRNVGLVSRECPVLVLSHPDDPITGSKEAIKALHDAVELGGIEYANYSHIEIQSSHKPQSDIGPQGYPYERKDESEAVVQAIRERLGVMNVPVTV